MIVSTYGEPFDAAGTYRCAVRITASLNEVADWAVFMGRCKEAGIYGRQGRQGFKQAFDFGRGETTLTQTWLE